jgi:hypothetical protein
VDTHILRSLGEHAQVQRIGDLAPWLDMADLRRLSALAYHVALDGTPAVLAEDLPTHLMDLEGRDL